LNERVGSIAEGGKKKGKRISHIAARGEKKKKKSDNP